MNTVDNGLNPKKPTMDHLKTRIRPTERVNKKAYQRSAEQRLMKENSMVVSKLANSKNFLTGKGFASTE